MNVRIEWKYREGVVVPKGQATSGRSEPMPADLAKHWVDHFNARYPEIEHIAVPVEEFDVLTGEGLFPKAGGDPSA